MTSTLSNKQAINLVLSVTTDTLGNNWKTDRCDGCGRHNITTNSDNNIIIDGKCVALCSPQCIIEICLQISNQYERFLENKRTDS